MLTLNALMYSLNEIHMWWLSLEVIGIFVLLKSRECYWNSSSKISVFSRWGVRGHGEHWAQAWLSAFPSRISETLKSSILTMSSMAIHVRSIVFYGLIFKHKHMWVKMITSTPVEFYIVFWSFNINIEFFKMEINFIKVLKCYGNIWKNSEHNVIKKTCIEINKLFY